MGLLEVYFGTIAFIITLIGLARGYSRELGSTMIILVAIFLLLFAEDRLNPILSNLSRILFSIEEQGSQQFFLSSFYQLLFIIAVFAGYAGRTIIFTGDELPPPQGTILNILIGGINGYLIAGTLWYYHHAYGYPLSTFGWMSGDLSPIGSGLVRLLPQYLMPSPTLWMIPIAVLLLLRVRG